MELAKLVCGGKVEQYQRIKCASVEFVSFSDGEVDEKREETEIGEEHASLIVKGNNREIELQDMSEMRTVRTPKISTFARKSSPLHSKETIELCIHKMDNTSFTLEVSKKATVLGLKNALQKKFEMCGCQISWPHVWGNFCLTFNNQKLLENTISLQMLGITNSDELYFVRHVTRPSQSDRRSGFFKSIRRNSA